MLCYRCGSHVPDGSVNCPTCGQSFASGGLRQATGTFSRRKLATSSLEGAPYKPGDVLSGRYTIRDIVGQGPVGYVFRAHDKEIDVEVALKSVSPRLLQTLEERRAFAREFKAARKLNHNNIARIYEEGEHQDRPYYTSQFLDGLSLRKIIDLRKEKGQFFRVDEVEPILAQIANALDDAHKAGVVHGDLKPENILVLPDLLKVTDFSLGMAMPRLPFVNAQKTRKADRYCAPEFVSGGEVSSAVDVYALGAILGEMLAGALPEGGEIPELIRINPAVSGQLDGIYRRAVNENPSARFARAGALATEIAILAGNTANADEPGPTVPISKAAMASALAAAGATKPPPLRPGTDPGRVQRPPSGEAARAARPGTDPGRKTSISRRPPPPPVNVGGQTVELEITPSAGRPPPPVPGGTTDELRGLPMDSGPPVPVPPPPNYDDPQEALPTRSLSLPNVVDSNGQVSEEPTQVVQSEPGLLAVREHTVVSIAQPLPPKPRNQYAIVVLMVIGLLAGVGGGWLYLQHENHTNAEAIAEQQRAEAERQRKLDEEDAGRLRKIDEATAVTLALRDAGGAETSLTNLPDAGPKKVAVVDPPTTSGGAVTPPKVAPLPVGSNGCPDGMVSISAGDYLRGYKSGDQLAGWDESPLSKSHTDAYCIDAYEYPNQAGGKPTTNISFGDAKKACEDQGKRLCSEDEWERACKGPNNTRFTWGEGADKDACNLSRSIGNSGDHPKCKSGYGVYDLSGNAAEWTSSRYTAGIGGKATKGAPGEANARCAGRVAKGERSRESNLGFRCCRDSG